MCGFVVCLVLLSSGVSDKKLLRSCEEISSSSSCVGEEDHSPALNGHDIQSLAITAQDLERVRESVCVCLCLIHTDVTAGGVSVSSVLLKYIMSCCFFLHSCESLNLLPIPRSPNR